MLLLQHNHTTLTTVFLHCVFYFWALLMCLHIYFLFCSSFAVYSDEIKDLYYYYYYLVNMLIMLKYILIFHEFLSGDRDSGGARTTRCGRGEQEGRALRGQSHNFHNPFINPPPPPSYLRTHVYPPSF